MTCKDLMQLKAKLLCYGVKADKNTRMCMKEVNSYILDKGFMHAAHFLIGNVVVNTCISEAFCEKSPYLIAITNDGFGLYENGKYITEIEVLSLPQWCNEYVEGYRLGDYIRPHSNNCVACWPYLICNYYAQGKQCQFCSMGSYHIQTILPHEIVGRMIGMAMTFKPQYEVALSGGTCHEPDHSIKYFANICENARAYGANYISVETAPPNELHYLGHLKDSGATAIIMNLEIADDNLRRQLCPGKSSISQLHYMHAYEEAVKLFGLGNVSCVLISGLQDADDIIRKSIELIDMGVIPTIIPLKPLDGCLLKNHPTANPDELIMISTEVEKILGKYGMLAKNQKGCTKCNGCSLETVAAQL